MFSDFFLGWSEDLFCEQWTCTSVTKIFSDFLGPIAAGDFNGSDSILFITTTLTAIFFICTWPASASDPVSTEKAKKLAFA